jgi:gamma-glutamylcyclotransferase (GGCT)/AIG2-like uncharacterized protein YtfP
MFYFAYDINLNRQHMLKYCPQARALQSAVLPNYKLVFSGWSREWRGALATIQASHGDRVAGGIYEISEADLARLDRSKGYPVEYTRIKVVVYPDTGPAIEAVTHILTRQTESGKPSVEYLTLIQKGYRDWGLI